MALQIIPMQERHLDQAHQLTQKLKWPHRREDWQQAWALGEGLVAVQANQVLGTLLFWRWGRHYASTGLVIVAEEAQGRGIGRQLMQSALEKLAGYNVRLCATEQGRGLYEKLGFMANGDVRQHQTPELAEITPVLPTKSQRLRPAQLADLAHLVRLDSQAHGQSRADLFINLLENNQPVLLLEEQGEVKGFAARREFGHGVVIGPIICHDLAAARVLINPFLSDLRGRFVRIDTPDPAFSSWLTSCGLHEVDRSLSMIHGRCWHPSGTQTFGLMSQAMG